MYHGWMPWFVNNWLCFFDVRDQVPIILLFEQRYLLGDCLMFHHHIVFRGHMFSNPPVSSYGQEEAKIRMTSRCGSRVSDPDNSFLISPIFHNHRWVHILSYLRKKTMPCHGKKKTFIIKKGKDAGLTRRDGMHSTTTSFIPSRPMKEPLFYLPCL